jgi:hypothetical protein
MINQYFRLVIEAAAYHFLAEGGCSMKTAKVILGCTLCLLLVLSCEKKEQQEQEPAPGAEEETISFTSEEIGFGVYFDEEFKSRTVELAKGQTEVDVYIVVHFPEDMGIAAVEYRVKMPEGVKILSDSFYEKRTLTMGSFEEGFSEGFDCVYGPSLLLHKLKVSVDDSMKDATIALLPSKRTGMLGIAKCDEFFSEVRASSYKAVINPTE